MKYYVYISDEKVNMLYEQIPVPLRKRIATKLKIDLKLFSATFAESPSDSTRISKLQLVVNYIEENEPVGTVDNSATYFSGTMNLRWGPIWYQNAGKMVYFSGVTDNQTILGLGGSIKHVIGGTGTPVFEEVYGSSVPAILRHLRSAFDESKTALIGGSTLDAIGSYSRKATGEIQNCEFLAKRLLEGNGPRGKKVLLGSPIYVALVD